MNNAKRLSPKVSSYADTVNLELNIASSNVYIPFRDRMISFLKENPSIPLLFTEYGKEFKRRKPQYKLYEDMYPHMVGCGENIYILDDRFIDKTMQRPQVPDWICEMGGQFDPFLVNALSTNMEGEKSCIWDGQQTATLLVLVSMFFFGKTLDEAIATTKVPMQFFATNLRAEARNRFIKNNNGEISRPLSKCDLAALMIHAVRLDNSTVDFYKRIEEIQSALEVNNMFFSDENRADVARAGALSRYTEIWNYKKFHTQDIINVIKYHGMALPSAPVEPLEIDNLAHIFMFAREAGIIVDDDYIEQIAIILDKVTKNTWAKTQYGKSAKHGMVARCYKAWRNNMINTGVDSAIISARCNQTHVAPAWILQTLKLHGFSYKTPQLTGNFRYYFSYAELTA